MPILTEEERLETLIAGRYRLESILGRGGTGVVFEAVHTWTGRRVAVKLLRPEYARDLGLVRRLLQEARAAAELEHPHVVQVLDMGADDDGTVYLVFELLRGESLSAELERSGTLDVGRTLEVLLPVMDALAHAHARDIVHRDLKPDNVFLRRDAMGREVPTLLDFGMAQMVKTRWGHATQSGTLVGTPFYMSPEQAQGEAQLGPATDVWSMGVILYRCLTGRLPFEASTPTALLLAIVQRTPAPVREVAPGVPEAVARAVDRAIAADRQVRFGRIGDLAQALRDAASGCGVDAPPPSVAPSEHGSAPRARRAHRSLKWVAAAAVLVMAAGTVAVIGWRAQATERAAEANPGREPAPPTAAREPEPEGQLLDSARAPRAEGSAAPEAGRVAEAGSESAVVAVPDAPVERSPTESRAAAGASAGSEQTRRRGAGRGGRAGAPEGRPDAESGSTALPGITEDW